MTPLVTTLEATALIDTFSTGRTHPYLTLCSSPVDDNVEVVLKLRSGFESSGTGLTCELMASLLARDLGLPVPEPYLVEVGDEFCEGVVNSEVTERLKANKGINFGTRYFTAGYVTWPQEMPVPACMLELAAEVFAFDFMIQNPDRRRDKPNLLRKSDELLIFDHELGFSFLYSIFGDEYPWEGRGIDFIKEHIFYNSLKASDVSCLRLHSALKSVTNERVSDYLAMVPDEWRVDKPRAAETIGSYILKAVENSDRLFEKLAEVLR